MVKKIYFFMAITLNLSVCLEAVNTVDINNRPRVTVWIHGTQVRKLLPAIALSGNHKSVAFFEDFMPGLVSIHDVKAESYVPIIAQTLSDANSMLFPYEHFFQFGWSGDIQVPVRRQSGWQLYHELKQLIARYVIKYGVEPLISIISHSHGGNVLLHMSECYERDADPFFIDRVILLACPIQVETASYVTSTFFKSVINIYSEDDIVQVIDPQCIQPFIGIQGKKEFGKAWHSAVNRPWFSKRRIQKAVNTCNVRVSWIAGAPWHDCNSRIMDSHMGILKTMSDVADIFNKARGLSHIEIEMPFFLKHIPDILSIVDSRMNRATEKITIAGKLNISIH